ncbi:hypothetical protein ACFLWG_01805 [Chloroflexota bacterium]
MISKKRPMMANNRPNVLMSTEKDIGQLIREWYSVPAWIKTRLPVKCLTHRYEGELLINGESLVFKGRENRGGRDCKMELPLDSIIDTYLGFSERLTNSVDPAFDMKGPMPFVVRYRDNGNSETLYFTTTANNDLSRKNNLEWYITLSKVVTKNRRVRLLNWRNPALVMAQ